MTNQSKQNNKIIKTANKIVWVEKWITRGMGVFASDFEGIVADQLPNGKWESTLKLPMIHEIVTVTSNTEIGAMLKMGEAQAKLLKKYLEENKEVEFPPLSKIRNWEIVGDEDGNFISLGTSSKSRKRSGETMNKMAQRSIEAVVKAIEKIKHINGSDKGLTIHVYDESHFPPNATIDQIWRITNQKIYKELGDSYCGVNIQIKDSHVIAIGYSDGNNEWEEETYAA